MSAYITQAGNLHAALCMTNCFPGALNTMAGLWGGKVYHKRSRTAVSRTTWAWYINGAKARQMATDLIPYCVEKRLQLELFLQLPDAKKGTAARQLLVDEIKALKHINYADLTHRR